MKAYFDEPGWLNLKHLAFKEFENRQVPWSTFDSSFSILRRIKEQFDISYEKDCDEFGMYHIKVRGLVPFWSGLLPHDLNPNKHILKEIPEYILQQVRERKLVIVIDNQEEGFSLMYGNTNCFEAFHNAMQELKLPTYSVVLMDSNAKFNDEYENWCLVAGEQPLIAHSYSLTGFHYFVDRTPEQPLVIDALNHHNPASFNSLNRTKRIHRMEHLYFLIQTGLHNNNLVSGGCSFTHDQEIIPTPISNTNLMDFRSVLEKTLPLTIDGDWTHDNPDLDNNTIFNHSIYKNSLLSFVTETAFGETGLFITEKTFKAIVAGHPFVVLGQVGTLKFLRELGYKTDFSGIDSSYDDIINPRDRFYYVHEILSKWVHMSLEDKKSHVEKSLPTIYHNLEHFKKQKYVIDTYIRLRETLEKIETNTYRNF